MRGCVCAGVCVWVLRKTALDEVRSFVTVNSEVKHDSWDKCCWALDLEVRVGETRRWDLNRKLQKTTWLVWWRKWAVCVCGCVWVCDVVREKEKKWLRPPKIIHHWTTFSNTTVSLLASHQCHSSLIANYTKSLRRSEQTKAKRQGNAYSERLAKFHMIPYLSQLSLQSQSSLLWLPDFIIIKQSFPSRNSSKRLNNKSTFFIGRKWCWNELAGMFVTESFEWEKHRLLATCRNSNTLDGGG